MEAPEMKPSRASLVLIVAAALAAAIGAIPAQAGTDVDFGIHVRAGDRTDLFFSISSRYFDRDRPVVETWGRRLVSADDVGVFLFLVAHSGHSPEAIYSLRKQGVSWFEIGTRVGIPVDLWFVPVDGKPGPPYGKAYGHWKKHKKNRKHPFSISDEDARNLIAVRMIHEYYGIPVEAAMELRASGRDLRSLLVDEYETRHGASFTGGKSKPRVKTSHGDGATRKEDRHHD